MAILPPNRLIEVARAIEAGEPVNLGRVARLQALDMVNFGRQIVEEMLINEDEANEQFERDLGIERGSGT